jgi:hypothetical protein
MPNYNSAVHFRDDEAGTWRTWLIVAIFVTMLITAIATALIMKFCCMQKTGDVSPRDEMQKK